VKKNSVNYWDSLTKRTHNFVLYMAEGV